MSSSCENKTILVGYVSSKIEKIDSDPIGVKFKVTTNETFFSKKHQKYTKASEVHFCKTWKQNALFSLKNLSIGDYVYILGKIHYHIIEIEDGPPIRNSEIIVSKIIKLNRELMNNKIENKVETEEVEDCSAEFTEEEEIEEIE